MSGLATATIGPVLTRCLLTWRDVVAVIVGGIFELTCGRIK